MIELLQQLPARQAKERPDAVAVSMDDVRISYGELEELSTALAAAVTELGCVRGDRACLMTPKTPQAITAMLGVLETGAAYVPIDVDSPAPRVARIVQSADPQVVIYDESARELLDEVRRLGAIPQDTPELLLETDGSARATTESRGAHPAAAGAGSSDIAHLLFTSGSTGDPKGVAITHANVLSFVEWAVRHFRMKAGERVSGHAPLHFDLSTFDIFGAFAVGAELHLVPARLNAFPKELGDLIRRSRLTQWFSVPSVMTYMAMFDAVRDFPDLERVIWCGDVLPSRILRQWMSHVPHATFTNLYGPTEATIASSYYTVTPDSGSVPDPIPIGHACGGEELLVLDDALSPVPPGTIGDLYIAGVGLSPGYWRSPELTERVFLRDPRSQEPRDRIYRTGDLARVDEEGLVYFVGRADSQVKHRGYRVELGEIEAALSTVAEVGEGAVVGVPVEGIAGTAICCAYTPVQGSEIEPAYLRGELSRLIPAYMLPSRWLRLDALPKNANGKIDRPKLRELFDLDRVT